MIKLNPVVTDGNIFLMAHSANILGNMSAKDIIHNSTHENVMYRGRGILIKSVLAMILKNVKDMIKEGLAPTSVGIVWDERKKGKYHKSVLIDTLGTTEGYKGDRSYLTQEDVDAMDLVINDCSDSEERKKLQEAKLEAQKSVIINRERYIAREYLRENLPKFGIPSYSVSGFEADDLDLIFAQETEKLGGYQIHYSGDSDWSFHLRDKDIFWQVNRGMLYKKNVADIRKKFGIREDLSLLKWAELFYSAKGSHNFLQKTFDPSIKRVTKKHLDKLFNEDFSDITDMRRFEVQRACLRVDEFPGVDLVRDLHKEIIKFDVSASESDFKYMLDELSMADDQKFFMNRNYQEFLTSVRKSTLDQITY